MSRRLVGVYIVQANNLIFANIFGEPLHASFFYPDFVGWLLVTRIGGFIGFWVEICQLSHVILNVSASNLIDDENGLPARLTLGKKLIDESLRKKCLYVHYIYDVYDEYAILK